MENVIYSKFSCERKKEFQIVTKITEENNIRHIRKQAVKREGYAHISAFVQNMQKLINSESYKNVNVVKSILTDKSTVELEYIPGKTFEEIINDKAKPENTEELIATIKDFFKNFEVKQKFKNTEDFKSVFGDINFSEDYLCMDASNVDLIFSNVIVSDGKYYVSDYEWVFDFSIPFKYIIFRSIAFNVMISQMGRENIERIYKSFDITEEEIKAFYKMETSFQNYVSGEKVLDYYGRTHENIALPANAINIKKNVYILQLVSGDRIIEKKNFYKDTFKAEFDTNNIKDDITVRFGNGQAVIKLENITAYKEGKAYKPLYKGNDDFNIYDNYYFKSETPELYIKNDDMEKLEIDVKIYYSGIGVIGQYIDKIFEVNEINGRLNNANVELEDVKKNLANVNKELMQVNEDKEKLIKQNGDYKLEIDYLHSKAWFKIYFKMKKLKDKLFKR